MKKEPPNRLFGSGSITYGFLRIRFVSSCKSSAVEYCLGYKKMQLYKKNACEPKRNCINSCASCCAVPANCEWTLPKKSKQKIGIAKFLKQKIPHKPSTAFKSRGATTEFAVAFQNSCKKKHQLSQIVKKTSTRAVQTCMKRAYEPATFPPEPSGLLSHFFLNKQKKFVNE